MPFSYLQAVAVSAGATAQPVMNLTEWPFTLRVKFPI